MASARPRASASESRPLSAIFVGKLDLSKEAPTSTERTSYLPSPPHTNSNGSGSTGDSGTLGRKSAGSAVHMIPSSEKGKGPATYINDEDDDNDDNGRRERRIDDYDEDHTARLSDDRRSTGTGSSGSAVSRSTRGSNGALSRAKSLADRNRIVLDKLAAITSSTRTTSNTPPQARNHRPFSREPSPLMPKLPDSRTISPSPSRLSFTRSRSEVDLVSGSDTEKERLSSDDHSTTPPAYPRRSSPVRGSVRRRMVSAPSPPPSLGARPDTIRQSSDISDPPASLSRGSRRDEDGLGVPFGTARYKKSPRRAPLPQEFRDGAQSSEERDSASNSDSLSPEISTVDRQRQFPPSTPSTSRFDSPHSSHNDTSPSRRRRDPSEPIRNFRNIRSSTVREPGLRSTRTHSRWASEASASGGSSTEVPRRYEQRGGSAESPLANSSAAGRSLVGEGLRAAGLSPRKERHESMFTPAPRKAARSSMPNGIRGADAIRDAFRSPSRDGHGGDDEMSPMSLMDRERDRPSSSGAQRFQQNIRAAVPSSRPSTSAGLYSRDESPRIMPLPQRGSSQARASPHDHTDERRYGSPVSRAASSTNPAVNPLSPSTTRVREHPDILMDAFSMLEGHLSRVPSSSSSQANDCIRSAQALVENSRALNARLRAATSSALEEHIEAEVSSSDYEGQLLAAELWKSVGGEFRENLKTSDELVRTLTVFFLSFGKILRDNTSNHRRAGSTGSNEDATRSTSSRQSLDGLRRLTNAESNVTDEWGLIERRRGTESRDSRDNSDGGRRSLDSRRSLDAHREVGSSRKRPVLGMEPYVRSSTSMSYIRSSPPPRRNSPEKDREQERDRKPSVFSGFSSRKFFTARRSDQSPSMGDSSFSSDPHYSSPTPARHVGSVRVRPSLSTLPSASILPPTPEKRSRRNKTSTTSNATVRGSSIFPSGGSALPPQLATTSVSTGSPEEYRSSSSASLSRTSGSVIAASLSGEPSEREQRKRTLSATSDSYADLPKSPIGTVSAADSRGLRRARASIDQSGRLSPRDDRAREGRRRTIGGLFH